MSKPESKETRARRLRHERADLREAILAVNEGWAKVETRMAYLLAALLGGRRGMNGRTVGPGLQIYFAPDNTATRFGLIDAAILGVVAWSTPPLAEDYGDRLLEEWSPLNNALGRARHARNGIIHGEIREVTAFPEGKRAEVRITPPFADLQRHAKVKSGQMPGMAAADVERAAEKLASIDRWIVLLTSIAVSMHQKPEELPKLFDALATYRRTRGDPQAGVLIPQEGQAPPQPSEG